MASLVPVDFIEATSKRRSIRKLSSESPVPNKTVIQLAEQAILTVPSAFNNQSTRISVLFGEAHAKLWSIVGKTLLAKIGEERWNKGTKDRIEGFAKARGTILFWDDVNVMKQLSDSSPDIYKDKIDDWIHQSNGMHQYYLWTSLAALGFGVNLQHYNPLIDKEVQETWKIPSDWLLRAQMVFGTPLEEAGQKEQKVPLNVRLQVYEDSEAGKSEL